jgi:hypothetical protein
MLKVDGSHLSSEILWVYIVDNGKAVKVMADKSSEKDTQKALIRREEKA